MSLQATRSIADLPGPRAAAADRQRSPARSEPPVLHLAAEGWARRYGPIVRVDIGRRRIVGIADADEIHRILRERPDGFRRWRDQEIIAKEMPPGTATGVFLAEGEEWKRQRRLVVTALNSNHLHRYFHVVRTSTERLHRRLDRGRAGRRSAGDPAGADLLRRGHHLGARVRPRPEHAGARRERAAGTHPARSSRMFANAPRPRPSPTGAGFKLPADRALDRSDAEIHRAVEGFIAQAGRARRGSGRSCCEEPRELPRGHARRPASEGTFSDEEIIGQCAHPAAWPVRTRPRTRSAWTIWLLGSAPRASRRGSRPRRDEVLGEAASPPSTRRSAAALRRGGAARVDAPEDASATLAPLEPLVDTTICDTHIPAGTRLILLLRRGCPRAASEKTNSNQSASSRRDATAPQSRLTFGAGPRFCPGRNLAFLEAKSALAMIARNFRSNWTTSRRPVAERFNFTMIPKGRAARSRLRSRERVSH